jgi:predicted MFS family arabinose efflux permease
LFSLTCGLIEGRRVGYDTWPIQLAAAVVVFGLVALVMYERRREEPLVDPRFFRSIPLSVATITAILAFTSFSGFLFLNALYLQEVRGLRASDAGLCMLPCAVMMFLGSPISGRLVGAGKARIATVGAGAFMALAGFALAQLQSDTPIWQLLICYGVLGSGLGLVNAPITNAAVSGMPRTQAGLAAALASTSRQVGASLGVALAGAIAGHASDGSFTSATHPFWWLSCANGIAIIVLGIIATGARARQSVQALAPLLDP